MNDTTLLLHEVAITITAIAAVIAAVSSLRNGQALNGRNGQINRAAKKRILKVASPDGSARTDPDMGKKDWYRPPKL